MCPTNRNEVAASEAQMTWTQNNYLSYYNL